MIRGGGGHVVSAPRMDTRPNLGDGLNLLANDQGSARAKRPHLLLSLDKPPRTQKWNKNKHIRDARLAGFSYSFFWTSHTTINCQLQTTHPLIPFTRHHRNNAAPALLRRPSPPWSFLHRHCCVCWPRCEPGHSRPGQELRGLVP